MFQALKELPRNLIRNSLISFVVSPLIRTFQVCTLMVICIGNVSKEIIWLQRRKMENVFEDNEHIVCFFWCITPVVCFFCCITPVVEKNKEKARSRRNNSGRSEEDGEEFSNNDCDISFWIAFN